MRRSPMRKSRKKAATAEERRHLQRVADMGCVVCGAPSQVHHITSGEGGRITRTHSRCIPLCLRHHTAAADAVHQLGQAAFNGLHGLDILALADRLWSERDER